jgi:hypothetical protein
VFRRRALIVLLAYALFTAPSAAAARATPNPAGTAAPAPAYALVLLPGPRDADSEAHAINDAGQIVGVSGVFGDHATAVLWQPTA